MDKFKLLEKKDIDGYDNFSLFDYLSPIAGITDFAIASGTCSFTNDDNVRTGFYWINETCEMDYNKIWVINCDGKLQPFPKKEKNYAGVRVYGKYSDIKKYIVGEMDVNEDLSVGEFGYFPTQVLKEYFNPRKAKNTGIELQFPILQDGMFNTFDLTSSSIYEYKDKYILSYENQRPLTLLSDDQTYLYKDDIVFLLEPIRIWIDKKHDNFLSQDVIMGGIAYKSGFDNCEYDDYTESDIYRTLNIFENNIEKSMDLYDKSKIKSKKRK